MSNNLLEDIKRISSKVDKKRSELLELIAQEKQLMGKVIDTQLKSINDELKKIENEYKEEGENFLSNNTSKETYTKNLMEKKYLQKLHAVKKLECELLNYKEEITDENRRVIETVLINYGAKNVSELDNDKLILEASKILSPSTVHDVSIKYPSGKISHSRQTNRVLGIFVCGLYSPDFVRSRVSDEEIQSIGTKYEKLFNILNGNLYLTKNKKDFIDTVLSKKENLVYERKFNEKELLNYSLDEYIKRGRIISLSKQVGKNFLIDIDFLGYMKFFIENISIDSNIKHISGFISQTHDENDIKITQSLMRIFLEEISNMKEDFILMNGNISLNLLFQSVLKLYQDKFFNIYINELNNGVEINYEILDNRNIELYKIHKLNINDIYKIVSTYLNEKNIIDVFVKSQLINNIFQYRKGGIEDTPDIRLEKKLLQNIND